MAATGCTSSPPRGWAKANCTARTATHSTTCDDFRFRDNSCLMAGCNWHHRVCRCDYNEGVRVNSGAVHLPKYVPSSGQDNDEAVAANWSWMHRAVSLAPVARDRLSITFSYRVDTA